MFHKDYHRLSQLKEKLKKQLTSEEEVMNQPISIRDIFVYSEANQYFGEYKSQKYHPESTLTRLTDQIHFLAKITNLYHQRYYCEQDEKGDYTIKQNCLNKITRLLLHEFSLYTDKPLQMKEFSVLLDNIESIAKEQHDNVHLLLSSIAVHDGNKLLNVSLYIQCGKEPIIQTFCKGTSSTADVTYTKLKNFSQRQSPAPEHATEFIVSQQGKAISNNGIFLIKALGKAEGLVALDICLDFALQHTKTLLEKFIDVEMSINTKLIPQQINHIVVSNSLPVSEYPESNIGKGVIHMDSYRNKPAFLKPNKAVLHQDKVTLFDLDTLKMNQMNPYVLMSVSETDDKSGYLITNPPFGSSAIRIIATEEAPMGEFNPDVKSKIDHKNSLTKKFLLESKLDNMPQGVLFNTLLNQAPDLIYKVQTLYQNLLTASEPSTWPNILNLQMDKLKQDIYPLIQKSYDAFIALCRNASEMNVLEFIEQIDIDLRSLSENLLQSSTPTQKIYKNFLKELIRQIDTVEIYLQSFQSNDLDEKPAP